MKGTLLIFKLTKSSSYLQNLELDSETYFDVLQWWITDEVAYQIRTFSLDQDLHIHKIENQNKEEIVKLARINTVKGFMDILDKEITLDFSGEETILDIQGKLSQFELKGEIKKTDSYFGILTGRIIRLNRNQNKFLYLFSLNNQIEVYFSNLD